MKAGWEVKTLGNIIQLEYGKPLEAGDRNLDGLYPVYGANGPISRSNKFYYDKPSIIVGRKGSAGEINLTQGKFWPLDVTYFVKFDEVNNELQFIYYLLEQVDLTSLAKGVKPGINRHEVYSIEVKIPSKNEQKRIVAILDQAFEGIAKARANAEQNLKNARALFESHLQSVFTQYGERWIKKELGNISKINYGFTESASYEKIGPNFLRITDIQDTEVNWETVPYCKINSDDLSKYLLQTGDIVFARTGATTGKSYLVNNPPQAVFASYLIRVQLKLSELLPEFLYLFFQTKTYWDEVNKGLSGSAQGGFNASKLANLIISFPLSIEEQKIIITELGAIKKETQRLEALYQRKIELLDELKKSLLQQAFAGEL